MRSHKVVGADCTRRDFLDGVCVGAGGVLLAGASPLDLLGAEGEEWNGPGGTGDYAGANGNTYEVMSEGHRLRDGGFAHAHSIVDAGTFDLVVAGGGISGLAAALFFQRGTDGRRRCLVLDDHPIFGGLAKENEFQIDGQRLIGEQASAMFFPPLEGSFLENFYRSIGIDRMTFEYQAWTGKQLPMPLGRTNYWEDGPTSAFFFGPKFGRTPGTLIVDPWGKRLRGAPIPEPARGELLAMHDRSEAFKSAQPKEHGDAQARALDRITLEQHLMNIYGMSRETVRTYLSPVSGGGSGLGADALSAYAEYAADVLLPWEYDKGAQMFPGGNAGVARHIVKTLLPAAIAGPATMEGVARSAVQRGELDRPDRPTAIRSGCTVISIQHEGAPERASTLSVLYSRGGRLYRVRTSGVIAAGGSWTAKRILKDRPASHQAAYEQFYRSPALVANVALRNWRAIYRLGIHQVRWFEGIGNIAAVRKTPLFGPGPAAISPDSPVVLTLKILFSYPGKPIGEQVSLGRQELLKTPFREYERRIREQLAMVFGAGGFDAEKDIAGIILNRWGHAYLSPQPGFFFGKYGNPAPGEVLRRNPVGRVAFANSNVTGIMDHRASIGEAKRAVDQVRERMKS